MLFILPAGMFRDLEAGRALWSSVPQEETSLLPYFEFSFTTLTSSGRVELVSLTDLVLMITFLDDCYCVTMISMTRSTDTQQTYIPRYRDLELSIYRLLSLKEEGIPLMPSCCFILSSARVSLTDRVYYDTTSTECVDSLVNILTILNYGNLLEIAERLIISQNSCLFRCDMSLPPLLCVDSMVDYVFKTRHKAASFKVVRKDTQSDGRLYSLVLHSGVAFEICFSDDMSECFFDLVVEIGTMLGQKSLDNQTSSRNLGMLFGSGPLPPLTPRSEAKDHLTGLTRW